MPTEPSLTNFDLQPTENDEVEKAGVKFSTEKNAEVSLATP